MLVLILRWQESIMHKANPQETWAPFVPALKELTVVCFKYVLFPHNSSYHTTYYSQHLIGRCMLMLAHSSHASLLPITHDLSLRTAHKQCFEFKLTGKGGNITPLASRTKTSFQGGVSISSSYFFPTLPATTPQKHTLPLKKKIPHRK